jgi:hypothetical protein
MLTIRDAISEDAALIRSLIQELAEYDGEADHVRTTEADIARDGFGTNAKFRTLIAEWGSQAVRLRPSFGDVESAQRCWHRSHTQLGRRVARLFDGQFWTGMNRL